MKKLTWSAPLLMVITQPNIAGVGKRNAGPVVETGGVYHFVTGSPLRHRATGILASNILNQRPPSAVGRNYGPS